MKIDILIQPAGDNSWDFIPVITHNGQHHEMREHTVTFSHEELEGGDMVNWYYPHEPGQQFNKAAVMKRIKVPSKVYLCRGRNSIQIELMKNGWERAEAKLQAYNMTNGADICLDPKTYPTQDFILTGDKEQIGSKHYIRGTFKILPNLNIEYTQ